MNPFNGFVIISLLTTTCFLASLISFLTDYETGKCEMTYMFEYPQFVRISNDVDIEYKKYGLYAYSEGRYTEKARNMQFNGIPVLFVPGSGGSHKQVRSFASIALRKAVNSRTPFHFDYFTVDLNNELSGLNGAVLQEQTDYVKHSIYKVLSLYQTKIVPKSVVLIGHSMGGVIVKSILANVAQNTDLVPLAILLSSPLIRPVVNLDYHMHKYYSDMDNFTLSSNTTVISVAGGYNDFLVPPYLTGQGHLNLAVTCVPKSWVSTDHLSVVWCKQLVMAMNRALFESVNPQTAQITTFHDDRLAIFEHHLVKHSGIKAANRDRYNYPISISNQGEWFETVNRQYSIRLPKGTREPKWYMLPLIIQPKHDAITAVALNMKAADWAFICPAITMRGSQRVCDVGRHLTQTTAIAPSLKYKRRNLRLNMAEAKAKYPSATHVVLRVNPTDEPVVFHIDIHSIKARTITVSDLPKWFFYTKKSIIELTEEKSIDYELVLPHLTQIIQSYVLYMEPMECTGHSHHATASLIVPWDHHDLHGFVTELERKPLNFRLYRSKPHDMTNESASIRLTLDPTCRYKISLKNSYQFGNMVRFYSPLLVANIATVVLMTLRSQLKHISEKERCSIFFTAIKEGAKPYYVVTTVKILSKLLSIQVLDNHLPEPDWKLLSEENLDFLLLPLILYMVSVGVVWILALGLSISFIFFESTVHKLALKFISKTFSGTASWTDHVMKIFEKIPGGVAIFLVFTSVSTCGGLAICLATGFYFLKLTQMSQDFIEDFVKGIVKSVGFKIKDKVVLRIKEFLSKYRKSKKEAIKQNVNPEHSLEDNCIENKAAVEVKVLTEEEAEPLKDNESIGKENCSEVSLETPMELEVCTSGEPDAIRKVDGEKLIQLLNEEVNPNPNPNPNKNLEDDVENEKGLFSKFNISWIKEAIENNEIFFHFTIFMVYFIVACLNIPSVLTWAHNFKYDKHLQPDPAVIPAVILSTCAFPLWQFEFPKVEKQFYLELSHIIYGSAIFCLIYGTLSIYRLSFVLSGAVAIITLHQLFAVTKPADPQVAAEDEILDDSYRTRVKDKLE